MRDYIWIKYGDEISMDILIFPKGIIDMEHPGQGIMDIAGAGFAEMVMDLSLCCTPQELEYVGKDDTEKNSLWRSRRGRLIISNPELLSEYMTLLLSKCRNANLRHTVSSAPRLYLDTKYRDSDREVADNMKENINTILQKLALQSIKLCSKSNSQYLIVPPLFAGITDTDLWTVNRKFYLDLAICAREAGVMILLENQCKNMNGHLIRGICSDGGQAVEWVDRLNEEAGDIRFGFCMDTGVCNICGQNMYDFCLALGDRLKAVILRDCDGSRENSMLPFTCVNRGQNQTDWLNLIRGLRKIEFDGKLLLNLEDTAAAFSPILRPGLLRLAKSVADYMKWQIGLEGVLKKYHSRVLFGAGNMCRNYMRCYGEQYPPLFTCDNNQTLWGTAFCGLEVKSPESLKALPPECAIFICNIYYREIETQLRDMGITNRIEYFNDEYMDNFYW